MRARSADATSTSCSNAAVLAITCCALLASCATRADAPPVAARAPLFERTVVVRNGDLRVKVFRIPALAVAEDGTLIAAFDARNHGAADTPADIDVMVSRSGDLGRTWSTPERIADYSGGAGATDASLLVDRITARVWVFFQYAPPGTGVFHGTTDRDPTSTSTVHPFVMWSDDHGASWQGPRNLIAELKPEGATGFWSTSGHGIQLSQHSRFNGRLVQGFAWLDGEKCMHAANGYSDDHGRTWKLGHSPSTGLDENKAVELDDGRVMQNYRAFERGIGRRLVALSDDGGVSFSTPAPDSNLPDPRNNASIIRAFPDADPSSAAARVLLFSNTPDPAHRRNLSVRLSRDSGRTWPVLRQLVDGPSMYSTLARLPDGTFGIFYEAGDSLWFARFDLAWLEFESR